jgi:hypothetical protein
VRESAIVLCAAATHRANVPARAPRRWANVRTFAAEHLRGYPLVRIEAVAGDGLDPDAADLPVSALARWHLRHPDAVCSAPPIDSLAALGCYLSHERCWAWLRDRPEYAGALVLEDDACPGAGFDAAWAATVAPLLADPTAAFDLLVLGYDNRPHRSVSVSLTAPLEWGGGGAAIGRFPRCTSVGCAHRRGASQPRWKPVGARGPAKCAPIHSTTPTGR